MDGQRHVANSIRNPYFGPSSSPSQSYYANPNGSDTTRYNPCSSPFDFGEPGKDFRTYGHQSMSFPSTSFPLTPVTCVAPWEILGEPTPSSPKLPGRSNSSTRAPTPLSLDSKPVAAPSTSLPPEPVVESKTPRKHRKETLASTSTRKPPKYVQAKRHGEGSKRRTRNSWACNGCRTRKVKCEAGQPCNRCVHMALKCVFEPASHRRQVPSPPTKPKTATHRKDRHSPEQPALPFQAQNPNSLEVERIMEESKQRLASSKTTMVSPDSSTASLELDGSPATSSFRALSSVPSPGPIGGGAPSHFTPSVPFQYQKLPFSPPHTQQLHDLPLGIGLLQPYNTPTPTNELYCPIPNYGWLNNVYGYNSTGPWPSPISPMSYVQPNVYGTALPDPGHGPGLGLGLGVGVFSGGSNRIQNPSTSDPGYGVLPGDRWGGEDRRSGNQGNGFGLGLDLGDQDAGLSWSRMGSGHGLGYIEGGEDQ